MLDTATLSRSTNIQAFPSSFEQIPNSTADDPLGNTAGVHVVVLVCVIALILFTSFVPVGYVKGKVCPAFIGFSLVSLVELPIKIVVTCKLNGVRFCIVIPVGVGAGAAARSSSLL